MLRGFTRSVSSCLLYRARGEVGQVWLCAVRCVVVISGSAFSELLAKV